MVDGRKVSSMCFIQDKSGSVDWSNTINDWETGVGIPMMVAKNYSKIGVLSSRYEVGKISGTQEVYREATIDMSIMETMTHNKKGVPSSINGIW